MSSTVDRPPSDKPPPALNRKIGWQALTVLGVSYVISGDFAGWNTGLRSGLGSFMIAFGFVSAFYLSLGLMMSELSAALPAAGGGYTFARCAVGNLGGYITGLIVLLEYVLTASAIGAFTTVYFNQLIGFDFPLWATLLVIYVLSVSVHIWGVGEAIKLLLVSTGLAVIGLVTFFIGAGRHMSVDNLTNSPPITFTGIWSAIPTAMWFYLAIEGVPLAAEEAVHPEKNVPRGLIASWSCLFVFGFLTAFITTGRLGSDMASYTGSPVIDGLLDASGASTWLSKGVNVIGLFGLLSSFFAVIYGYSRLTFALSRAGFLPSVLAKVNRRGSPWVALAIPSVIAYSLTNIASVLYQNNPTNAGNLLVEAAVSAATVSYMLIELSYLVLKFRQPNLNRPYVAPRVVPYLGTAVSAFVFVSVLAKSDWRGIVLIASALVVSTAYYLIYGYRKINDVEEEQLLPDKASLRTATSLASTKSGSPDGVTSSDDEQPVVV